MIGQSLLSGAMPPNRNEHSSRTLCLCTDLDTFWWIGYRDEQRAK
jgi:hypothetical protein